MADIPQNSFQGPLAPKYGLNDNFRNPIPGGPKVNIPKGRNYGKLIPVGAVALALLILPLTIQQLGQQQDNRQQASQPTPTISLPVQVTSPTPTPTPVNERFPLSPTPTSTVELVPPIEASSSGN